MQNMQHNLEDVLMQELLKLQMAELRVTGMYNALRSKPAARRNTSEFLAHLADLDERASQVERLLKETHATPAPRQLVA